MALLVRWFIGLLILISSSTTLGQAACPSVGVIRWDAWFGEKGKPGKAVEKSLGPARWHDRLPICGRIVGPDEVQIACGGVNQMEREIDDAAYAGIAYWAFLVFPEGNPMNAGLHDYLNASNKKKVKFALISELDKLGDKVTYRPIMERYIRLMSESGYQETADGRPLFYLAFVSDTELRTRFGGRAEFALVIDEFRSKARSAGLANPYIVLLERSVAKGRGLIHDLGLDAISAYAVADNNVRNGEYKQLAELTEGFWADASAAGLPLVPPVMTGWDRRPRVLNPVPWEKGQFSEEQMGRYFKRPTSVELQEHLMSAMRWSAQQKHQGEAKSVLIYAWNEFDEGGWLAPTLGDGRSRLEAVRRAIVSACPTSPNKH